MQRELAILNVNLIEMIEQRHVNSLLSDKLQVSLSPYMTDTPNITYPRTPRSEAMVAAGIFHEAGIISSAKHIRSTCHD